MAVNYNPKIVTDGLVLLLDAGNPKSYPGTGTVWTDLSPSRNNGTLTNGPTFNSANGGAIVFDGTNDYISLNNNTSTSFTISCWIKTTATSATGSFAYQGNGIVWSDVGGPANDFVLAILNNQASWFTGDSGTSISGTTIINTGAWFNLVAVKNGTNSTKTLFVNCIQEATSTSGTGVLNGNPLIAIGGNTLDNRYFNGSIASVSIHNKALSSAEILQNFNALRGRFGI